MNFSIDAAHIRKNIKTINTNRTKLIDLIQAAALGVIYHSHKHGDVTLASDLCIAVGKGMKHEALRLYLSDFGAMNPNDAKDKKAAAPMVYAKSKLVSEEELEAHMVKAAAKFWYDYKTEKPAEDFSFAEGLHALLAKLDKAVEKGYTCTPEEQAVLNAARAVPKPAKKQAVAVEE
mgnify:CR=1 FL=1